MVFAMTDQLSLFATAPVKVLPSGAMTGSGAIFSPCGRYRFRLWRIWNDDLPVAVFMGQNPSKAGAVDNDQTISKCVGFGRAWGMGGIVMINPFALVETDSAAFERAYDRGDDVTGADNDAHVRKALAAASVVILACGCKAFVGDAADKLLAMVPAGVTVECLGHTKEGAPRHPSRLAYDTPREPFRGFWPPEIPHAGAWQHCMGKWERVGDDTRTPIHLDRFVTAGVYVTKPSEARDAVSWG